MRTFRMGACNCEKVGSAHVVKVDGFGIPSGVFFVFFLDRGLFRSIRARYHI